jgi:hypothetical protein
VSSVKSAFWMKVVVVPLAPHPNDPGRDVG